MTVAAGRESGFRASVRRVVRRLRGGGLSPRRAALSVGVGLAIGVTPLWGLHLPLVLIVCLPLRLDSAVAYVAANISIPPIAPFLTFAEVELGARVLSGEWLDISADGLRAHGASAFIPELALGTALFAPLVGSVGAATTYGIARALSRDAEPDRVTRAARRVAERYARSNRFARGYVTSKLVRDPIHRLLVERAPPGGFGTVQDFGSGRGQLALFLLDAELASEVRGFDWDAEKVDIANEASAESSAHFVRGDLRSFDAEPVDTVLLVDVLHYFDHGTQLEIVDRAAACAQRRLIVRDIDPDRGLRSALTIFFERVGTRLSVNHGERISPISIARIEARLERAGFSCEVVPAWEGTPLSNVMIIARRESDHGENQAVCAGAEPAMELASSPAEPSS